MTNPDTMNFGPDWVRQLSETGSVATPPPTTSSTAPLVGKVKLAEYRYSREEMLAFYIPTDDAPECLKNVPEILNGEHMEQPYCSAPLSEVEQRLMNQGVNSGPVLKMVSRGSIRGEGRGGGMTGGERGRGRGGRRGGSAGYMYLGDDDFDDRDYEPRPRGRGRGHDGSRGSYRGRGAYYEAGGTGTEGGGADESDWRRPHRQRQSSGSEADTDWRRRDGKPLSSSGNAGGNNRGSWRQRTNSGGERGRANFYAHRGGPRRQIGGEHNHQHMPEWIMQDEEVEKGHFDSSGAFLTKKTPPTRNDGVEDIWQEDWETEFEQNYPDEEEGYVEEFSRSGGAGTASGRHHRENEESGGHKETSGGTQENVTTQKVVVDAKDSHGKAPTESGQKPESGEPDPQQRSYTRPNAWVDALVADANKGKQNRIDAPNYSQQNEKWLYRDPQGRTQGPFTDSEMNEWFQSGFFTPALMLKRECDETFVTLGEYVTLFRRVPFESGPRVSPLVGGPNTSQAAASSPMTPVSSTNPVSDDPAVLLTAPAGLRAGPPTSVMQTTPTMDQQQPDLLAAYLTAAQMSQQQQLLQQHLIVQQLIQMNGPSGGTPEQQAAALSALLATATLQRSVSQPAGASEMQTRPPHLATEAPDSTITTMTNISGDQAPIMAAQSMPTVWDIRKKEAELEEERRRKEDEYRRREAALEAQRVAFGREQAEFERKRLEEEEMSRRQQEKRMEEERRKKQHQQLVEEQRRREVEEEKQRQQQAAEERHRQLQVAEERHRHLQAEEERRRQLQYQQQQMEEQRNRQQFDEERRRHQAEEERRRHQAEEERRRQQQQLYEDDLRRQQEEEMRKKHLAFEEERKNQQMRNQQQFASGMKMPQKQEVRPMEDQEAKAKANKQTNSQDDKRQRAIAEDFKRKQQEAERARQMVEEERRALEEEERQVELEAKAAEAAQAAAARAEAERLEVERRRQQEQLARLQLPGTATWGQRNVAPSSGGHAAASPITEIQRAQLESEMQARAWSQHQATVELPSPTPVGGGRGVWGRGGGGSSGKTLADIQAEEVAAAMEESDRERSTRMQGGQQGNWRSAAWSSKVRQSGQPQAAPQPQPPPPQPQQHQAPVAAKPVSGGAAATSIWGAETQPAGGRGGGGGASAPNTNQQRQGVKEGGSKGGKGSAANQQQQRGGGRDDVGTVQRVFAESMPSDELTRWCEERLVGQSIGGIDIPTLVEFLRDLEASYEVEEYIKQYLGDNSRMRQFTQDFLEKRRALKAGAVTAAKGDSNGRAPGVGHHVESSNNNARTDQWQTPKASGGKKNKKKKMQRVNNQFLNFTCGGNPSRTNVGEIDTPE